MILKGKQIIELGTVKDNELGIVKMIGIKKKSGKIRKIYIPKRNVRTQLKEILESDLNRPFPKQIHGFVKGRNIATNAKEHIPFKYTLNIDLSDFFDTVDRKKLTGKVPEGILNKTLIEGVARQGLPTSPCLANIAAIPMDEAIMKFSDKTYGKGNYAYTRYADDLSISFSIEKFTKDELVNKLNEIISRCGFKMNKDKINYQSEKGGRRIVCGVSVHSETNDMRVPRWFKRKLRAATHKLSLNPEDNKQKEIVQGMSEFTALKEPSTEKTKEKLLIKKFREAQKLERKYFGSLYCFTNIKQWIQCISEKEFEDTKYEDGLEITNDPVYFLGISAFTSNWSSCNDITKKQNKMRAKGLPLLSMVKGVSIAAIFDKTKFSYVKGIKRHPMLNRAVVYKMENGKNLYGRIYGNNSDKFVQLLQKHGFEPEASVRFSSAKSYVVGGVLAPEVSFPATDGFAHDIRTVDTSLKENLGLEGKYYYSARLYVGSSIPSSLNRDTSWTILSTIN